MKLTITAAALLLITACAQPQPICDREAQQWNKFDTAEDVCATPVTAHALPPVGGDTTTDKPTTPDTPTEEPDTPDDKPKGNNGHGNGDQDAPGNSGGNNNAENSEHGGNGNSGNGKGGHGY